MCQSSYHQPVQPTPAATRVLTISVDVSALFLSFAIHTSPSLYAAAYEQAPVKHIKYSNIQKQEYFHWDTMLDHPLHQPKQFICLELYVQLQLFYSNNQLLYHLQRERFVQPLLQSGTLLVSIPVQLIHSGHLRTGLKLNCFNVATRNCFWRHRSTPDLLAN